MADKDAVSTDSSEVPASSDVASSSRPSQSASTVQREVIVNFAEPSWHKERLNRVEVNGNIHAEAAKKTRNAFVLLVVASSLTACAYIFDWSSTAITSLAVFNGLVFFALIGHFVTERDALVALRNAVSLANLSLTLYKPGTEHNYFESLVAINVEKMGHSPTRSEWPTNLHPAFQLRMLDCR